MERLAARESQALEFLYDRYARPVYSLVLRIAQQPAAAEEIVQDVFLQLWRTAAQFQASRGTLQPWLFTMARNRALDFLRLKSEKQRVHEESFEFEPPPSVSQPPAPQPELEIDQQRRAERVRALMMTSCCLNRRGVASN